MSEDLKIGIVGAGVVGLTMATLIQQKYPSAVVEIAAKDFYADTTSYGAAGLFRVGLSGQNCAEDLIRWGRASKLEFARLARLGNSSQDEFAAGAFFEPLYHLFTQQPADSDLQLMQSVMDEFCVRNVEHRELECMGFNVRGDASGRNQIVRTLNYTTLIVEPRHYLRHLQHRVELGGGRLLPAVAFESRTQLAEFAASRGREWDLVVNCSGLGSRRLFEDAELHPARGFLLRVGGPPAATSKFSYMRDLGFHAFSLRDSLVLGGFKQAGQSDTALRHAETAQILRENAQIYAPMAAIRESDVTDKWVGVRPMRTRIRIESDWLSSDAARLEGGGIPLVHNYGHGASGITLSYGTCLQAMQLVERAVALRNRAQLAAKL